MKKTTKIIIVLAIAAFFDMIIPIPFTVFFLIYIVLEKPPWFKELIEEIYQS